jgi:putative tryptophan/tyrosine transport system substrate-binding protein
MVSVKTMRRRDFITFLVGGVAAGAFAARAQQPTTPMRRVGMLMALLNDSEREIRVQTFQRALRERGWVEGKNLQIDYRSAVGDPERIKTYAAELVGLAPDVIVGTSTPVAMALRHATQSIPIVFVAVTDPVANGLVTNYAQPEANFTGFTNFEVSMGGKWIALLKEIAPRTRRVGLVFNPANVPTMRSYYAPSLDATSRAMGVELMDVPVRDPDDIGRAFDDLARESDVGVVVLPDLTTVRYRDLVVASSARLACPAVYPYRYFATAGGLLSYGIDTVDLYGRAAAYVDRILRGAKPADLPVQLPAKFEFTINLKTAKMLGLEVPSTLLARVNEVFE